VNMIYSAGSNCPICGREPSTVERDMFVCECGFMWQYVPRIISVGPKVEIRAGDIFYEKWI
jgi:hypothetical protein